MKPSKNKSIHDADIHKWNVIFIITISLPTPLAGEKGLFLVFRKTPAGRKVIDAIKLRTPLIGILNVKIVLARVTGTFATLIKSGIPILNSIKIVANTSNNTLIDQRGKCRRHK